MKIEKQRRKRNWRGYPEVEKRGGEEEEEGRALGSVQESRRSCSWPAASPGPPAWERLQRSGK